MFSMFQKRDPITEFWRFFRSFEPRLAAAIDAGDMTKIQQMVGALQEHIAKIDSRLCFEFGKASDGVKEFCVTPDGNRTLFDRAKKVAAAAPAIEGWRIFAFKRRKDLDEVAVQFGETKLCADQIGYICDFDRLPLSLTLWFDAPVDAPPVALQGVCNVFLDCALGEYDAATAIKSLDIRVGVSAMARPFVEFRNAFDAARPENSARLVGNGEATA